MEGYFERDGSVQPVGLPVILTAPSIESAAAPNLSLTATVHLGAQSETPQATATSASSSAPTAPVESKLIRTPATQFGFTTTITPATQFTFTTTITPVNPVPLPAAGLLLASGLIGVTGLRKRQQQE